VLPVGSFGRGAVSRRDAVVRRDEDRVAVDDVGGPFAFGRVEGEAGTGKVQGGA
jgi:hypothetical protein